MTVKKLSIVETYITGLACMCLCVCPGVNFINVLQAGFTSADPKSSKRQLSCQSFLCFWDLRAQKLHVEH